MDLPAEIRDRIYQEALVQEPMLFLARVPSSTRRFKTACHQPALTKTSKTVREEALPVFYGMNTFYISTLDSHESIEPVADWLQRVRQSRREMMRDFMAWTTLQPGDKDRADIVESLATYGIIAEVTGFQWKSKDLANPVGLAYLGFGEVASEGDKHQSN